MKLVNKDWGMKIVKYICDIHGKFIKKESRWYIALHDPNETRISRFDICEACLKEIENKTPQGKYVMETIYEKIRTMIEQRKKIKR